MATAERLHTRRHAPLQTAAPGLHRLRQNALGDALLFVPAAAAQSACPLVVMLHGAGGRAAQGLALLQDAAETQGLIVLAPQSAGRSWDLILADYGEDAAAIDALLEVVFLQVAIDARRVAIGGFSDGASYALSLGLANGDLFTHVIAFSPGFADLRHPQGQPQVFVSHGTDDRVLGIDACSRRLLPRLRRAGLTVTYREFQGGHAVPDSVRGEALQWLLQSV